MIRFKSPILGIMILALGWLGGFLHGHRNLVFEQSIKPTIVNTTLREPDKVDFSLFWDAYNEIARKAVVELNPKQALYGSISGLVGTLKDPFSVFLNPDQSRQFIDDLAGQFDGIGAELALKDNQLIVVAPLEGSPAQKSGIKAKDVIVKIDGVETSTLSFGEAIGKIRGAKRSVVKLTIARQGQETLIESPVTRDTIRVKSVTSQTRDQILVIKVSQFGQDTLGLVKSLASQAKRDQPKGIVLDLRNNPGGFLDSAIDISSLFLDGGTVVFEQDKTGQTKEFQTTLEPMFDQLPMVVIINAGSASASEIVAGALQDRGRSKIVGEQSFGKGSVQDLTKLRDGSTLRITTARWLTPNKRQINSQGIQPDEKVQDDSATEADEQLNRAIELLSVNN